MKLFLFLSIISIFSISCSTITDVKGPDGTKHKVVTCADAEDCYEDAAEVCGKYKIINTSEKIKNGYSRTKMLVKCENSKKE